MTKVATNTGAPRTEAVLGILAGGVQFALLVMVNTFTGYGAQLTLLFGLFVSLPTLAGLVAGTAIYARKGHLTNSGYLRIWVPTLLALGVAITTYDHEVRRKDEILTQWEKEAEARKYENTPGPLYEQSMLQQNGTWIRFRGTLVWDSAEKSVPDSFQRLNHDGYKLRPGQYLTIEKVEQMVTPGSAVVGVTPGRKLLVPVPDYEHVDLAMKASYGATKRAIVPRQVGLALYVYPDHIETAAFFSLGDVSLYEPRMGDKRATIFLDNHSGRTISRIQVNGWGQFRPEESTHCGGTHVLLPYALSAPLDIAWQTANDRQWHHAKIESLPPPPPIPNGATEVDPYDLLVAIKSGERIEFHTLLHYSVPSAFSLFGRNSTGETRTDTTDPIIGTPPGDWIPVCPESVSP